MDPSANAERIRIIEDLNYITRELEQIAAEMRNFKGIGTEYCASQLLLLSNRYKEIRSEVSRI